MTEKNTAVAKKQERFSLGIELGSTRIKSVLLGPDLETLATGGCEWRSSYIDGYWTYDLDDVWRAVQESFCSLREDFYARYGAELTRVGSLGISAMMHGYLAFDERGELLTRFRTWQNSTTQQAAEELTRLFGCNIPLRWSIAHLHQAVLGHEAHVPQIAFITTLAGYVHFRLTGKRVLGIGDASGMFPIDDDTRTYDAAMLEAYGRLVEKRNFHWTLEDILPTVLSAGEEAGRLTDEGARLLDPTGTFEAGALLAPPEGDAGTGMVATNSVRPRTANVSAGTSIFAMVVLDHPLASVHEELDMVTTPAGDPVVMVHCNNGANDLQNWVSLLGQTGRALGADVATDQLFRSLFLAALDGDHDAGGVISYNYRVGEPITDLNEGRPMVVRLPDAALSLPNFMRAQLYSTFAVLRLGFEILRGENVDVDQLFAHGGVFRTPEVAQRFLAAALDVPVTVGGSASEGGAWGMALLAAFMMRDEHDLADWLDGEVFRDADQVTIEANADEIAGFNRYMTRYVAGLSAQRAAVTAIP